MFRNVIFKGRSIHYQVEGSGKPVILLHGFLESLEMWDGFATELSKELSVIRIDLPGFGKSESIGETHTMELMADSVKAVIDQEQIENVVMAGHSMGGYTALAFAEMYPEYLSGLCLFHSQAAADDEESKQNRTRTIEVVKNDHQNFISNFIPLLFAEENIKKFSDEIVALKQMSLKTSAMGVVAALAGMRDREDSRELLTQLNIPLFFVVGKQDSRIPLKKILPQLTLSKHTEVLLLDGVGHMGFLEAPKTIFPILTGFFKRCLL